MQFYPIESSIPALFAKGRGRGWERQTGSDFVGTGAALLRPRLVTRSAHGGISEPPSQFDAGVIVADRVHRAANGKAASKFAAPNWNDLRGLTPEERRLVLDYFKRINAEKP